MLAQLKRLARHSAIYGLGGLVARILAVLLLPLYTRYLTARDYGAIETLIALVAVLTVVFRAGNQTAFFRFYFDSPEEEARLRILRTSFWFNMGSATIALVLGVALAPQISHLFFGSADRANLVRAAFVGLWANMNYQQLTSLFRVEERSVGYVIASLTNVLITIGATLLLVVVWKKGAVGVIVGNFSGTLAVYLPLLAYRREQLGLQFDRRLWHAMERFGLPLMPAALAAWAVNFLDRFLLVRMSGQAETGLYSIGVRLSSAIVFLLVAFRAAWPAFAYSIADDREARRTYAFVLTYLVFITSWLALALGGLAPWLVRLLTTPRFYAGAQSVALLSFAGVAYAGFAVMAIGVGRARRTQWNWTITGLAAAINVGLNFWLIPAYGQVGAAIATLAAYVVMFVGMTINSQLVYPVPYQWRRIVTVSGVAAGLTVLLRAFDAPLAVTIAGVAAYPLLLFPLGFYLPVERRRLRRLYARSA